LKRERKNSQKKKKKAEKVTDGANVQGWTAKSKQKPITMIPKMFKKRDTCLVLRIYRTLAAGSPANLAFLFGFDGNNSFSK
jgi:hypothetical protein